MAALRVPPLPFQKSLPRRQLNLRLLPCHCSMPTSADTSNTLQTLKKTRPDIELAIAQSLDEGITLKQTELEKRIPGLGARIQGKVRDLYHSDDFLVLVSTDRQSAFDRVLAAVPFKGQVLNETSAWWFRNTRHITQNAFLDAPDPNVTIARKCEVFPVEFVVRGFITGSTSTSLWTVYNQGIRNYCGNALPEGLIKNDRLQRNMLTPTTKAVDHDEPVTPEQIVERGLMTAEDYEEVADRALRLFSFGQEAALERGLLLVDTKYEFGRSDTGEIVVLDEVHTPDSSRFWLAGSYEERHRAGLEPENIDKEFLRLWFRDNCDPYNDAVLPAAPRELIIELSWRYIALYETITGCSFQVPSLQEPIQDRIARNLAGILKKG